MIRTFCKKDSIWFRVVHIYTSPIQAAPSSGKQIALLGADPVAFGIIAGDKTVLLIGGTHHRAGELLIAPEVPHGVADVAANPGVVACLGMRAALTRLILTEIGHPKYWRKKNGGVNIWSSICLVKTLILDFTVEPPSLKWDPGAHMLQTPLQDSRKSWSRFYSLTANAQNLYFSWEMMIINWIMVSLPVSLLRSWSCLSYWILLFTMLLLSFTSKQALKKEPETRTPVESTKLKYQLGGKTTEAANRPSSISFVLPNRSPDNSRSRAHSTPQRN